MKLGSILGGQVARFLKTERANGGGSTPLYDLIRGTEARYRFVEAPRERSQMDFAQGVRFSGGSFEGEQVERLELYGNAVLCEMRQSTNMSDKLIDDLIEWIQSTMNAKIEELVDTKRFYTSELEFEANIPLDVGSPVLSLISNRIPEIWTGYGHSGRSFSTTSFACHLDVSKESVIWPAPFTVERRTGHSFEENFYFSRAPLKTEDHLSLLAEIEDAFSA